MIEVLRKSSDKLRHVIEIKGLIYENSFMDKLPTCTDSGAFSFAIIWAMVHNLGALFADSNPGRRTRLLLDEMLLSGIIKETLRNMMSVQSMETTPLNSLKSCVPKKTGPFPLLRVCRKSPLNSLPIAMSDHYWV